ncbi:MAG: ABC transporter permease, partial [Pseudomonadota bacterium]|nr:ABC transporter permease [Pseudomonadota bacterium]
MADITTSKPASSEGMKFFRRFLKRKTVAAGVIVLAIFVLLAVLAPWIAPYSPSKLSIVNRLKPPSEVYWFGTDEFGRDVFSRTIFAGRLSLLVGAAVV